MAKCKYPNEVCANMTVLNGETYCGSVPCSLKDDLPKQTNADRIRNMSDEELEKFLRYFNVCRICKHGKNDVCNNRGCTHEEADGFLKEWLQAEVEEQNE